MNTNSQPSGTDTEPRKLPVEWADSEWFLVWLRLAKRDYQGRPDAENDFRARVLAAA